MGRTRKRPDRAAPTTRSKARFHAARLARSGHCGPMFSEAPARRRQPAVAQAALGPGGVGHFDRRDGGDLAGGDGRRGQLPGPAADQGAGRQQHHRADRQAAASEDAATGGSRFFSVLQYGLLRDDYERIGQRFRRSEQATPMREIRREAYYLDRKVDVRLVGCTPQLPGHEPI